MSKQALAENMKKTLYAAWLGGSLSIAGLSWSDWSFWVVMLPTVALVTVFNNGKFDLE
jgi:fatty acid desaturase